MLYNGCGFVPDAIECGYGEFRCPYHCISAGQRCNGVWDCEYGDDERDCGEKVCLFRALINVR
jgi:hypothetical protein